MARDRVTLTRLGDKVRISVGECSVVVARYSGMLTFEELRGGNAAHLLTLIRELKRANWDEDVYMHVFLDDPNAGRLMRCYTRLGGKPYMTTLRAGDNNG